MFRDRKSQEGPRLVSANHIDAYQLGADPKTDAPDFIVRSMLDLSLERVHPWAADGYIQKALALAFLGQAGDRMSEILYEEGLTLVHGNKQVPEDIAHFAGIMSRESARLLRDANHLLRTKPPIEFHEDDLVQLTPDNQMPAWPLFSPHAELPYWQDQHESPPGLSMPFLRGTIRAAKEAQGFVFSYQQEIAKHPGEYPDHLAPTTETIQTYFVAPAEDKLGMVEGLMLSAGLGDLDAQPKMDAYHMAHEAYVYLLLGGVATFCPRTMGPEWGREPSG